MSSVWVVLLDASGSMGEGFSASPSRDPLAERGAWRTKLEAAKELLLSQIAAAARIQDVAVFRFADRADKLFHGARSQFSRAEASIRTIEAGGETNLAGALTAVREDTDFERYSSLTVLILSDGLANVGDPVAEAERLIAEYPHGRIDTILIDETQEGRRIAESVSINGKVTPAFSQLQLGEALELGRAASLLQELAGFEPRRLELESELSRIVNAPVPTLLTVTSPLDLSASSLQNQILPTLEALENLEHSVCDVFGMPYKGAIKSISQNSPISISLAGLREAVELALEWVIPWRRENAQRMAALKLRQQELENNKLEMQLSRELVEIEKAQLENRRLELAITSSKLELADHMLDTLDPHRSLIDKRREFVLENLVRAIDRMSEASIEFTASGPGFGDERLQNRR